MSLRIEVVPPAILVSEVQALAPDGTLVGRLVLPSPYPVTPEQPLTVCLKTENIQPQTGLTDADMQPLHLILSEIGRAYHMSPEEVGQVSMMRLTEMIHQLVNEVVKRDGWPL